VNVNRAGDTPVSLEPLGRGRALERRRKDLHWVALALLGALGIAFVVLAAYGHEGFSDDYHEPMLLIGLLALLTCAVAYFADKEREHRIQNRNLIRELHETAHALDTRVARLNKLCETSTHLAGALDVERISELVVDALVAQVQADAASLVLLDKAEGRYLHTRSTGPLGDMNGNQRANWQDDKDSSRDPEHIAKAAAGAGADSVPTMRVVSLPPQVAKQIATWGKTLATIYAPMRVSELIGGALAAVRQDDFSSEDLNLLTTLANMASKAIESAELHEELRQSYFRTLHVLARSLAARDPYSASHGEAVTSLACRIAEKLGLAPDLIEFLRSYGPLHDLGKIGISDTVLLKAGPLSEEELSICRQHTVIGEEIIRPLNPGTAVMAMIRNHHERWDGKGYPDGLSGDEIPILARVVAVADSFHAMTSHRPYRPATVLYAAIQEVRSLSGLQFDPMAVNALLGLWEAGEVARLNMRAVDTIEPAALVNHSLALAAPPSSR